jgi:thioredoxin-dependent peroxiredoxin
MNPVGGIPGHGKEPEPRTVFVESSPYTLSGPELAPGDAMPDFALWQYSQGAAHLINRELMLEFQIPALFCCLHSVDTRVGTIQARKFERLLMPFDRQVAAFLVSSDLPFTQNRYSEREMLSFLSVASDYRGEFGKAFGIYIPQLMFLTRAVFITDPSGIIQHVDIVSEFTHEPEYDAAIDVLSELV